MKIGKLRYQITIERFTESRSTTGQVEKSWATYLGPMWARIEDLGSQEAQTKEGPYLLINFRFTIRYVEGLTNRDRIRWGSRLFNLTCHPSEDERKRQLVMMANEVQSGA